MLGSMNGMWIPVWIGFGILAYGICYFLIHDVYIHRRFKWFRDIDHPYFYAIRKAHKIHHKYRGKEDGECFGMLIVPYKFYKEAKLTYERRGLKK
jgi:beta-carotene 3-hydroxylase